MTTSDAALPRQWVLHVLSSSRRLAVFSAAVWLSFCALAAPSASARPCGYAKTPIRRASRRQLDRAVVCLVNRQRAQYGLPRLRENRRLNRSAQGWTNAMIHHDQFTHGSNFAARLIAVGFHWSTAGENIAAGFRTPASVVAAWMGSPGHCRNILAPVFRNIGIGVSDSNVFGYSGVWTEDFGLKLGRRAPSRNWGPADACPRG